MKKRTSLSRRELLMGTTVYSSTILSGCVSNIIPSDENISILNIKINNYTLQDQIVLVAIENEDGQVYADTTQVSSSDGNTPKIREIENIPESPGMYDTYFDLERNRDIEGEFWVRYENVDKKEVEYVVNIVSDTDGNPILELSKDSIF